jgi:electron transport complex protein RnfD
VLLALCLPPLAPWWLVVSGVAFAILLAKHLFGGLGANPFNPAMVGYAVLLVSFPRGCCSGCRRTSPASSRHRCRSGKR